MSGGGVGADRAAERVDQPPAARLVHAEPGIDPAVLDLAVSISAWDVAPTGWCGGRAGWQLIGPDAAGTRGSRALKLKGLGAAPFLREPARPPSAAPYDRWPGQAPDPHFGVRPDGEFAVVAGAPSPWGGLTLAAAWREVTCAASLTAADVPSVAPISVIELPGRTFETAAGPRPLGVSVTGSPVASVARVSVTLPGFPGEADVSSELERLGRVLDVHPAEPAAPAGRLALLGAAYQRFGSTLSAFSAAGWYRYSGHPGNFVIDDEGRAVLVDLDSCQPMGGLPPEIAALEAVRDAMSALYNLACSFFRTSVLDGVPDAALIDHQPFSAFLDGWDPSSAGTNAAVGAAIAEYVVRSRAQLRDFDEFLRSASPAGRQLYRFVRHDRDLTFIWLYRIVFARRCLRPAQRPMPFDLDALDDRLLRFAGRERFERMQELVC